MKRIIYTRTRFCRRTGVEITNTVTFCDEPAHFIPVQEHIEMSTPTEPRYPQKQGEKR